MPDTGTLLTRPEQIAHWHFLSRAMQLSLEMRTGMKHRYPILRTMYREGLIDADLRGTFANKHAVLTAMADILWPADGDRRPPRTITEALAMKP